MAVSFALPTANLALDRDTPVAADFGDVYFQGATALEETRHVFIDGLNGEDNWLIQQSRLRLLEVGFGTGSNFLAFADYWQKNAAPDARLIYSAIEGFPLRRDDLAQSLAALPATLQPLAQQLLDVYPPPLKGVHSLSFFGGRVTLRLLFEDAAFWRNRLTGGFDGLLLDGFSPAKNPELWSPELLAVITERVRPGGRLATFAVSRPVRDPLTALGWQLTKRPGFGRKRECLAARLPGDWTPPQLPTLQINGAGVAGCALFAAAQQRGLPARLSDCNGIGAGASGNPLALVDPRFSLDAGALGRFRLGAIQYAQRHYDTRGLWRQQGIDLRPSRALPVVRIEKLLKLGLPEDWLDWNGEILRSSLGGSVVPLEVLGSPLLSEPEAGLVINAVGHSDPRVRPNRGQITVFEGTADKLPTSKEGYAAQLNEGALIAGASYRRFDRALVPEDWQATNEDDADNRIKAAGALGREVLGPTIGNRVSMRATTPDHLPIMGQTADGWTLTGLGSRGFTFAPILADALISLLLNEAGPLDGEALALLHPARFDEVT